MTSAHLLKLRTRKLCKTARGSSRGKVGFSLVFSRLNSQAKRAFVAGCDDHVGQTVGDECARGAADSGITALGVESTPLPGSEAGQRQWSRSI